MDWLKDFVAKFKDSKELDNLKAKRVKGMLQLNFSGGEVKSCKITQCVETNNKEQ